MLARHRKKLKNCSSSVRTRVGDPPTGGQRLSEPTGRTLRQPAQHAQICLGLCRWSCPFIWQFYHHRPRICRFPSHSDLQTPLPALAPHRGTRKVGRSFARRARPCPTSRRSSSPTGARSPSASCGPPMRWARKPSPSSPRKTSWACTASRRMRPTGSARGCRPWGLTSASPKSSASPNSPGPMPSTPAMACCPRTPISSMPAKVPASPSSAPRRKPCAPWATRLLRGAWR